jgi:hypothetical protein
MRKNTIIEHDQFKQINSYNPAVKGSAARNHLKMEMLNSIISVIGEKWTRMKQETKSALEQLCFLSIERGFVYCSPEYVGERHNVNSNTMKRSAQLRIRALEDSLNEYKETYNKQKNDENALYESNFRNISNGNY